MKAFGERNRNLKCVDENKAAGGTLMAKPTNAHRQPFKQLKLDNKKNIEPTISKNVEMTEECLHPKKVVFGGGNTLIPLEYAEDICKYFIYLENIDVLAPNFLDDVVPNVDGRMRLVLVDWMVHVQNRFELHNETLSLAVWMLDRCLLNIPNLKKDNLQLLVAGCILVASKYEDIMPPHIQDLIHISADIFTKKDILAIEHQILKAINFRCYISHSLQFLKQYHSCLREKKEVYNLGKFICDVALVAYALAHYKPSTVGAVALYLSAYILEQEVDAEAFYHVTEMNSEFIYHMACEFAPYVLKFGRKDYRLVALREKHHKYAPVPFKDVHVKRIQSLL